MSRRQLAQRLEAASPALRIHDVGTGWPSLGTVTVRGTSLPVTIWVGPIGLSHRGRDDVERRFQNPGSNRPIWTDGKSVPLLLGLWETDPLMEVDHPVIASADPLRRAARITRFSIFVGLNSLVDGGRRGWSEALNGEGERISYFTPANLPRLVAKVRQKRTARATGELDAIQACSSPQLIAEETARLAMQGLTLQ